MGEGLRGGLRNTENSVALTLKFLVPKNSVPKMFSV